MTKSVVIKADRTRTVDETDIIGTVLFIHRLDYSLAENIVPHLIAYRTDLLFNLIKESYLTGTFFADTVGKPAAALEIFFADIKEEAGGHL